MLSKAGKFRVNASAFVFLHIGSSTFFCLLSDKKLLFQASNGDNQESEILPPNTSLHGLSSSHNTKSRSFCRKEATARTFERSGPQGIP